MTMTVIRGGRVLDTDKTDAPFADILIDGDTVREIGPPGLPVPEGAASVDAADRLIIPGLINAHTHGTGALARGSGDRWTLELLLNAGGWLTGTRGLEHKYLSALLGALEMLKKGCTACYDLYGEFPSPTVEGLAAVAQAYNDAGMRAVIAPMMADRSFYQSVPGLADALPDPLRGVVERFQMAPYEQSLAACREVIANWRHPHDRIRPALAPTIPLHCSDDFITGSRDLAAEHGLALHMHLAESKPQAIAGPRVYGKTLTRHLDALGFITERFTGAHGVWLDDDDIAILADRGAAIAHNPGSNMRLGSGVARAHDLITRGVTLGVGTDGPQCADNQNMFEALRLAAFASRLRSHDPDQWVSAHQAFHAATAGSAKTLGFDGVLGRIAPGYKADLVFLDLGHIHWFPMNDPLIQLVMAEDATAVTRVMVGGRLVVEGGEFVDHDLTALRSRTEAAMETLRGTQDAPREIAEKLSPLVNRFCHSLSSEHYHMHAMATHRH